jgi:putative ABC transport system permease protein
MFYPENFHASYMAVKVRGTNISQTLGKIEELWQEFLPREPFDYFFMDTHFESLHQSESRTAKLLAIFSVLALFIASLGLFGLSSFITEQRTKEIGVRKVMGSTVSNILLLLSRQFTKWVLIANLVAWPVAFYFMDNWLQNFAYRIDISPNVFILTGVVSILLALLTIGYQTIKAASTNPARSLRYE